MAKGFGNMMKQAQKLQKQMMEMQEEIAQKTVEGSAGGGMVKITANGNQDIIKVKIDPEVVDPDDVELLEDLIVAAVTNAREKAKSLMEDEMGKVLPGGIGSLGIPGLG
ncbi:MAG: YbaB/EbfC family nucleoid-associated protein [Candidatus Latescibacteria bacterium]|jgi:nucleoid-associated protein EbfC|nr:YbaB/EbfC family nucleoid-associated protein [Candidatus Latescibacterota bacterium]